MSFQDTVCEDIAIFQRHSLLRNRPNPATTFDVLPFVGLGLLGALSPALKVHGEIVNKQRHAAVSS